MNLTAQAVQRRARRGGEGSQNISLTRLVMAGV